MRRRSLESGAGLMGSDGGAPTVSDNPALPSKLSAGTHRFTGLMRHTRALDINRLYVVRRAFLNPSIAASPWLRVQGGPSGSARGCTTLAGIPHIKLPGPGDTLSSTRAMVVSLTNAVNHPVKLTTPSVGVVNWRSIGSGDGFHYVCTPFELSRHAPRPWLPSSPPMTPRTITTPVLDGARRYA
jgi:hypothetical protein